MEYHQLLLMKMASASPGPSEEESIEPVALSLEEFKSLTSPRKYATRAKSITICFDKITAKGKDCSKEFKEALEEDSKSRDTPGSKWTLGRFEKFFPTFTIYDDLPLSPSKGVKKMSKEIKTEYKSLSKIYIDPTKNNFDVIMTELLEKDYNEATIRLFLNAFIKPIVQKHKLQLRLEETLDTSKAERVVPRNISDYTIYTSEGEILGCIEAKANCGLTKHYIQCMLQLISLRERSINTLFNILTDANKFIFVIYNTNDTFQFETHEIQMTKTKKTKRFKIYTVCNFDKLQEVVGIVDALIMAGKKNRKESAKDVAGISTALEKTKSKQREKSSEVKCNADEPSTSSSSSKRSTKEKGKKSLTPDKVKKSKSCF